MPEETLLEKLQRGAKHLLLHTLEVDYKEYTPDQGMPPIVYELNDAQLDYLIAHTLKEAAEEIGKLRIAEKAHLTGTENQRDIENVNNVISDAQRLLLGEDKK